MFFTKRISYEAVFLLGVCLLFFLLRFPSLFEPYWYGDEGVYFTIGKALNQGRFLYIEIWDNKPPLLYLFYAVFNDLFSIRFASLTFGLASVITFFFLAREFFRRKIAQYTTTFLFSLFFGLPTLEGNIANAENFLLFPVVTSAFLFWRNIQQNPEEKSLTKKQQRLFRYTLFVSGLLLGIASLFKIVAVFDFAAFLLFAFFIDIENTHALRKTVASIVNRYLPYIAGFFLPLLMTSVFFFTQGALREFLETILLRNVSYVGEKNVFLIPHGFLFLKFSLLLLGLITLFLLKARMSKRTLFILLWLAFSLFNTFFSQRPYIHYQLVLLPSLALAAGMILSYTNNRHKIMMALIVGAVVILLYNTFPRWKSNMIIPYYHNFVSFITGEKKISEYQAFFDNNTPRDYALADYLTLHTEPNEAIFLWGNSPQIYYLSDTLPTGRYTVSYHINTPESVQEIKQALRQKPPRFIVLIPGTELLPFTIPEYSYKLTIVDSTVYERINK